MMKTNIILIIAVIALSYFLFKKEKSETIIKEKIEIAEICEILDNTKPAQIEKVYIYINKKDKNIVHVTNNTHKDKKKFSLVSDLYSKKEVNKFIFKDSLKNGFLTSTILADNIYKRDVELKTFEKTKTIEKMTFSSRFYIGGSIQSKGFKELNTVSVDVYLAKQKSLLLAGYGYDLTNRYSLTKLGLAFNF